MPAAVADWMPTSASSKTRQSVGVDAEAVGGEEEGVGRGLAVGVVAGADEGVEEVEDAEGFE